MKRTDLAKNLGLKIQGRLRQAPVPGRFGSQAAEQPDRREQRKLDQAAGLVPFAVKLHKDLVGRLQDEAARQGVALSEFIAGLLEAGLAAQGAAVAGKPPVDTSAKAEKNAGKAASKAPAEKPAQAVPKAASKVASKAAAKKPAPSRPV